MPSSSLVVERAQPWLGTLVAIRVRAPSRAEADRAIDAAFAEIRQAHALMSFHGADSDLTRLNRAAPGSAVRLDARTAEVLAFALELAERTHGAFDPAIAAEAVVRGELPAPPGTTPPDPTASWRDVVLEGCEARRLWPVWLDLGGVAKGYAIDRAIGRLAEAGIAQACVNAGGDLRVLGPAAELVQLLAGDGGDLPVIELSDGALASSGGDLAGRASTRCYDAHRRPIAAARFASVAAPRCMAADALTKVVLAGAASEELLAAYGACAWTFAPRDGWRSLGQEAA